MATPIRATATAPTPTLIPILAEEDSPESEESLSFSESFLSAAEVADAPASAISVVPDAVAAVLEADSVAWE